jgi:acyl-CoA reductase-like NAD-dependent aldehyde dehydrogenase
MKSMKKIVSINPATGDVNREFELYSQERINESIKRSKDAFSDWKRLDISERGKHLINAAKVLRRRKQELRAKKHQSSLYLSLIKKNKNPCSSNTSSTQQPSQS